MPHQQQPQDPDAMHRITLADAVHVINAAGASVAQGAPHATQPTEPPHDCALCHDAGWTYTRPPGAMSAYTLIRCECKADEDAAKLAGEQRAAREQRMSKLRGELGSLALCTFANFRLGLACPEPVAFGGKTFQPAEQVASIAAAVRMARAYADEPAGWLMLAGPVGSGKSHLAAAVANRLGERLEVAYASVPAMLRYVRAGFADHSADARLDDLISVGVLVLDDMGAEQLTGWSEPLMYDLLNARYLAERPTVLTTNLTRDELPPRIASRISERCGDRGYAVLVAYDRRRITR